MVKTKRDPKIGKAWLAWHALQGDEPIECVADYLEEAHVALGAMVQKYAAQMEGADATALADISLVLMGLSFAASGKDGPLKMQFKRRTTGKPIDRLVRANAGHKAAFIAEGRVADGWPKEAAVQEAMTATGLSRAEVFSWLRHRQQFRSRARPDGEKSS